MNSIQLLLISISIFSLGSLAALLLRGNERASRLASGYLGVLASLSGIFSAGFALVSVTAPKLILFRAEPFGQLVIQIDGLSAFMVGLIGLIGIAASIYSLSSEKSSSSVGFFTNIFMATMLMVVTVTNTFYFLIFWELMTLASYFLVIWQTDNEETARTGYIYMIVAHAGAALIMLAFLVLFLKTDSFDFSLLRHAWLSPGVKSLVFLLIFFGFGAKIGMAPLHFWTPATYAAAPDHASALMAGVMKKTAIYGILRIGIDLLGASFWWWGFLILVFGAFSTVVGAFYALSERDLKRMLAYSSVENAGIILMGVGIGTIGVSIQLPALAILGFLAALYHTLNHAFFKGLLFMGAGVVIDRVGSSNLNRMGGLGRHMPKTALAFLIGAIAVAAIPPFNGFVSEWFTYQAFFTASQAPLFALRVFAPLSAVLLALAGAVAVMVYIKAYGGAFTGPARSQEAAASEEGRSSALFSMAYLALGCLVLGIGAPYVAPVIARVAAGFLRLPVLPVANSLQVFPGDPSQAVFSAPLAAILLIGLLVVPLILAAALNSRRAGRRSNVEPWSCGYGYSSQMSLQASSFDQPVKVSFRPLYQLRTLMDKPFKVIQGYGLPAVHQILRAEPVVETVVTRPAARLVEKAGQWIQGLQMGDIRIYCLYIIVTLAILLFVIFGGSGL
jgi:hydrogenase-4 component B